MSGSDPLYSVVKLGEKLKYLQEGYKMKLKNENAVKGDGSIFLTR
jgi:hypothetical protein